MSLNAGHGSLSLVDHWVTTRVRRSRAGYSFGVLYKGSKRLNVSTVSALNPTSPDAYAIRPVAILRLSKINLASGGAGTKGNPYWI